MRWRTEGAVRPRKTRGDCRVCRRDVTAIRRKRNGAEFRTISLFACPRVWDLSTVSASKFRGDARLLHAACGGMMGWASLPLEVQFPIRRCTVSQIEIDEALIRNAHPLRNRLEVVDALFVQTDSDLFLELRSVRVLGRFGKIVFSAHDGHPFNKKPLHVLWPYVPR